ncbi:MAG TPA: S41 family peptidase [Arsenicitalea sp.]|nr:S41 family peptidase [Arsenicitalea sp.]
MSLSPIRAAALAFVLALSGAPALVSAQEQPAPAPTAPADQKPAAPAAPADQKPAAPAAPADQKPAAPAVQKPATPPATTPSAPATPANPAPPTPDAPAPTAPKADAGPAKHPRDAAEIYSDLDLFGEVFDRIRAEYVDPPDEKELIHAALNGMLTSLDPHSGYLAPQAYSDMQQDTSGQFGGLGIEVTMEDGVLKVVSPIDDTPAARAGILPNDFIVELDGVQVQGESLDDAVKKMRGPIGSKIKLTIARDGSKDPLYFELTRETIAMRAVRWSMEGDVAVLRLSKFSEQAFSGIQSAITDIYKKNNGVAPKGMILDLRNNPGGLVDQAVQVSDAFLKQGAVVLTRGRQAQESARYDAKPDALDAKIADVPLVVLINGGSASAAEIVAGALQDHKRATLIGTRSFGKGTVQSIISLGGDGAMRLTTARYYTPNNRSIQAAGIQPDITIKETIPDEFKGHDEIVGEAALPGQIGGGTQPVATTGSSVYVPADKTKDDQLQYALKLIDGKETNAAYPPKAEN